MRLAFLGTPDFAVAALARLVAAGHDIACVYAQPPAPRGRGQVLKPSPVHAFALAHDLPVRTPASMRSPEEIAAFQGLNLDAACVVAYGQILPREVLEAPRLGAFNLHGSLLPRWRGAAPIQRAVMAGDPVTGVQVMRMTEGLDEGPVLATATVRIGPLDTAGDIHDRLAAASAALLADSLPKIAAGELAEVPQAQEGVTYAKKIRPREARIDWTRTAAQIDGQIRGLSPFPGAWCQINGERVKLLRCRLAEGNGQAGKVLGGLTIACGTGAVQVTLAQREGKKPMPPDEFLRGFAMPGFVD